MVGGQADLNILAATEIFRFLPVETVEEARSLAVRKRIAKRTVLYHQGDAADTFYVVIVGRLRAIQTAPDGSQIALRYLGPGELAGYAALSGIPTYPGTVTAVEDTHLFSWSAHTIRQLMGKHAQIAINALAVLGTRYQETQTRLRELSTETVERRIAHTLMRLAQQAGRRTAQGIEICFPLSRQDFAELAGTTLHTVSRTLSAWEKDGIVSSTHRYIVIHRPDVLEQLREDTL
ncbi:Crp/Fnr family transcriptional regulator [Aquamicrobium soli]|jgi:CRP-like cAMP-binding protein|uniref:Crp/Fnr family transcriptional regulator n=1 Tax=Aquamicrobium soli TaxID=1811518 RepID=A0ABV7KDK9_9HYPH